MGGPGQLRLLDEQKAKTYNLPSCRAKPTAEDRQSGALLIAASLIAAIRLRGEQITHSPKVVSTISESLSLARMVLQRINAERQ
jgi:hypothetical protein